MTWVITRCTCCDINTNCTYLLGAQAGSVQPYPWQPAEFTHGGGRAEPGGAPGTCQDAAPPAPTGAQDGRVHRDPPAAATAPRPQPRPTALRACGHRPHPLWLLAATDATLHGVAQLQHGLQPTAEPGLPDAGKAPTHSQQLSNPLYMQYAHLFLWCFYSLHSNHRLQNNAVLSYDKIHKESFVESAVDFKVQ